MGRRLLLLPSTDPVPVLLVVGLFLGLPVGVIVSMPTSVLPSESRAVGMGVFFTWLYVGHSVLTSPRVRREPSLPERAVPLGLQMVVEWSSKMVLIRPH